MAAVFISPALSVLQIIGAASGVPYAQASICALQAISTACLQVDFHKGKCAQLAERCAKLLMLIHEHAIGPTGNQMQQSLEEVDNVLYVVRDRMQKWSRCGRVKRFFKMSQVASDLDKCKHDVDTALERLHIKHPLVLMAGVTSIMDNMNIHQERIVGMLAQAQRTVSPQQTWDAEVTTACCALPEVTVQDQIQNVLTNLRFLTKMPPTIKVLNDEVTKIESPNPQRCGMYSDIWLGKWRGEKVALKALRILTNPEKASKIAKRYEHEMNVWAKLKHDNILKIYGVIINPKSFQIVTTWQENGNALEYRVKHPHANPLTLLTQAARGIKYLHGSNIVHGNLKCNNILVSSEGVACIGDFGHTRVLGEVLSRDELTSYSGTLNMRWNAPELVSRDDAKPTKASDVFAFGMSILELVTKQAPYSHIKRDLKVIGDITGGRLPLRPAVPEDVARWMCDGLWEALNKCWCFAAQERIDIEDVIVCLETLHRESCSVL